ncbi:MAG: DNA topoisomerase I [Coriobacteriia bacterium]|nr:DNA topoisomerase I [Coriobacteriia bacterium]
MNLVISEKNIAARRIAEIMAVGKPTAEKVYTTAVYRFRRDGEEWVSIGLKGHIMEVDFASVLDESAVRELATVDPRVLVGGAETLLTADGDISLKKWRLETLPVLARVHVEKVPKEKGIIQSIKNLSKKADKVIIATDYDREGELIGADARDVVRSVNKDVPVSRVRFSAITKEEIERAFAEEGVLSEELAQAGETRQDIDLIWGAVLTRYLTLALQTVTKKPFGDVLSSGRVQTPTLKLIVDREKEREAFIPEDYWVVRGNFSKSDDAFVASHSTDRFKVEAAAQAVMDAVAGETIATVTAIERSKRSVKPPVPFNTTALMAAAASEGISPAQTMRIAESLYMSGYMSYPRVDNTVYPPSLDLKGILKSLSDVPFYREYAQKLLKKGTLTATRGPKETTDHPPIHPTGAADPDKLDPQAWKLYNMVARRFMATLSGPAIIDSTRVDIDVAGERFRAKGDVIASPGFRAIYPYGLRKDDHLPTFTEGETIDFGGAEMEGKQTQPSSRFSQGKLIQEMEKLGLGTKATRHDTIQTLYDRKYVQNDPMEPTNKGRTVIDALSKFASEITTPDMTVALDREMDAIASGKATLPAVVGHSQDALATVVEELLGNVDGIAEMLKGAIDEDAKVGICPKCGHDLLIKYSPRNRAYFVGCSGYPDCDVTYPLPKNAKYQAVEEMCEVCGSPQVKVIQFKKRPRVMCLSIDCPTKKGPEIMIAPGACPKCGGDLKVAYSQVGNRYVRCTNYEECKTAYPLPQQGEIEPIEERCECGAPKVIVHTKKGPWKICIDPDCPQKPDRSATRRGGAKKSAAKSTKKGTAKGTRKTTTRKKPTSE